MVEPIVEIRKMVGGSSNHINLTITAHFNSVVGHCLGMCGVKEKELDIYDRYNRFIFNLSDTKENILSKLNTFKDCDNYEINGKGMDKIIKIVNDFDENKYTFLNIIFTQDTCDNCGEEFNNDKQLDRNFRCPECDNLLRF